MMVILRKLFQIDRHQWKRFIHEFFEGGAFFSVAVVRCQSVNCPGGNGGREFGGDF